MKTFKAGDTLTLTDVIESFRKINGTGMPNDNVDLSNRPMDKDGAIIFDSWEDVERAFGKLISLEDHVNSVSHSENKQ